MLNYQICGVNELIDDDKMEAGICIFFLIELKKINNLNRDFTNFQFVGSYLYNY